MSASWLITLYIIAALAEIAGVVLVVVEIARDIRSAQELAKPGSVPAGISETVGGVPSFIGGRIGELLAETAQNVDTFRDFTLDRLTGGIRLRLLGVVLIVIGIAVGAVANIGSAV